MMSEGRSKSRTKVHFGSGPLVVSTRVRGNPIELCDAASLRNGGGAALLQSALMSVMRHTARTRSSRTSKSVTNWPGGNFESAGFKFGAPVAMPGA